MIPMIATMPKSLINLSLFLSLPAKHQCTTTFKMHHLTTISLAAFGKYCHLLALQCMLLPAPHRNPLPSAAES